MKRNNYVVSFDPVLVEPGMLSDDALFVYGFLKSNQFPFGLFEASNEMIQQCFFKEEVCQSSVLRMKNAVRELISLNLVEDVSLRKGAMTIRRVKKEKPEGALWICDTSDTWEKFMEIPIRTRFKTYRFYLRLLSSFDLKYRNSSNLPLFGKYSMEAMAFKFQMSKDMVERYIQIFENYNIISRFRSRPQKRIVDGELIVSRRPSIYCRYADRDECDAFIDSNRDMPEFNSYNTSSWERPVFPPSVAQIYSRIAKGEEYPYDKVKEIYRGVVKYNRSVAEYGDPYKPKSIDCFKDYDFYRPKDEFEYLKYEIEDKEDAKKEKKCAIPKIKKQKKSK